MSKTFVFLILLVAVSGVGGYFYMHRDDNRLRMDNLQLRAEKAGPITDGTVISPSERVRLTLSLRGCKADGRQMCSAKVTTKVEGPGAVKFMGAEKGPDGTLREVEMNSLPPFEYRKNSAITSMEVQDVAPGFPPGDYTVTVIAEDLVGKKTTEQKFKLSSKL